MMNWSHFINGSIFLVGFLVTLQYNVLRWFIYICIYNTKSGAEGEILTVFHIWPAVRPGIQILGTHFDTLVIGWVCCAARLKMCVCAASIFSLHISYESGQTRLWNANWLVHGGIHLWGSNSSMDMRRWRLGCRIMRTAAHCWRKSTGLFTLSLLKASLSISPHRALSGN